MDHNITIDDPSFPILFQKGIVLIVGNNPKTQQSLKAMVKQLGAFVIFSTKEVLSPESLSSIFENHNYRQSAKIINIDPLDQFGANDFNR